jgi:hypothetical protein
LNAGVEKTPKDPPWGSMELVKVHGSSGLQAYLLPTSRRRS